MIDDLSTVAQDYLKVVWSAHEWSRDPITTTMLARRLRVTPSTVSEAVQRLVAHGYLSHAPYGSIELTETGRSLALAMVRRHRLLEAYLVQELSYTWDEVHDEAEVLEHVISERLLERIDTKLGHPLRDPHGDPIPTADGLVQTPMAKQIAELPEGHAGSVARVSDADPEILRYLASAGVALDAAVRIVERRDFAGTVIVELTDRADRLEIGLPAARAVWLTSETRPAPRRPVRR